MREMLLGIVVVGSLISKDQSLTNSPAGAGYKFGAFVSSTNLKITFRWSPGAIGSSIRCWALLISGTTVEGLAGVRIHKSCHQSILGLRSLISCHPPPIRRHGNTKVALVCLSIIQLVPALAFAFESYCVRLCWGTCFKSDGTIREKKIANNKNSPPGKRRSDELPVMHRIKRKRRERSDPKIAIWRRMALLINPLMTH